MISVKPPTNRRSFVYSGPSDSIGTVPPASGLHTGSTFFVAISYVLLVAACGPVREVGDIVWSSAAITSTVETTNVTGANVVIGSDGELYKIPFVEGSDLVAIGSSGRLKTWSFYLLKNEAETTVQRTDRPLSVGAAIRVNFGDAQSTPPTPPSAAPPLNNGQAYIENSECDPARMLSSDLAESAGSIVRAVEPLRIWRRSDDAFDVLMCSRSARSSTSPFMLTCSALAKKEYGDVGYSFVTRELNECVGIAEIFFSLDDRVTQVVASAKLD